MRYLMAFIMFTTLYGCSSGLKEAGFKVDDTRYLVTRSQVVDRGTANQPHSAGQFYCTQKITSVDMAILRQDGDDHSWYKDCVSAQDYTLTSDQSLASLLQGPLSAAILAGGIGAGLALSGDDSTVNNHNSATGGQGGSGGVGKINKKIYKRH